MTTPAGVGFDALKAALGGVFDAKALGALTPEDAMHAGARAIRKLKATLARLQDYVAASTLGPDRAERMFSNVRLEVEREEAAEATDAEVDAAAASVYPAAPPPAPPAPEGGE